MQRSLIGNGRAAVTSVDNRWSSYVPGQGRQVVHVHVLLGKNLTLFWISLPSFVLLVRLQGMHLAVLTFNPPSFPPSLSPVLPPSFPPTLPPTLPPALSPVPALLSASPSWVDNGGQSDFWAGLPLPWQELPADKSHAAGQAYQQSSKVLLPLEEELQPVLPHGQTRTQEQQENQVLTRLPEWGTKNQVLTRLPEWGTKNQLLGQVQGRRRHYVRYGHGHTGFWEPH